MLPNYNKGDIAYLKKAHPCGSFSWKIERIGADIGLSCQGCARQIMLSRAEFNRRLVRIEEK